MLSMELKSSGSHVSRGLGFQEAEFELVVANLSAEAVGMYNLAAALWRDIRTEINAAIALLPNCNIGKTLWSRYWSVHQVFFKQLAMSMKVPTVVEQAKEAIQAGGCVVIGLQTTGEASTENALKREKANTTKNGQKLSMSPSAKSTFLGGRSREVYRRPDGLVSLCEEVAKSFLMEHFPVSCPLPSTAAHSCNAVAAGAQLSFSTTSVGSNVSESTAVESTNCKCVAKRDMLIARVVALRLPPSALDSLIHALGGPSKVSEMTGRRGRLELDRRTGEATYVLRAGTCNNGAEMDSLNVREKDAFMRGEKLVAVISDAASTGISLHADLRVSNTRRRTHITLELPWAADKAVQQLGRSHRSSQASAPKYKLLTSGLGGENRFVAAIARRLETLGALTQGDRRAGDGGGLALGDFNVDTQYGRRALITMYDAILTRQMPGGVDWRGVVAAARAHFKLAAVAAASHNERLNGLGKSCRGARKGAWWSLAYASCFL